MLAKGLLCWDEFGSASKGKLTMRGFLDARAWIWFVLMFMTFVVGLNPFPLIDIASWPGYGDEQAYLAHALTVGLDADLDYSNEPLMAGEFNPTHRAPKHPIGPGFLAAPFVALFSIVDRVTNHPVIRNHHEFVASWAFFGFLFSKAVYFFFALWLYFDAARRIQRRRLSPGLLFLIVASSGVVYYVLFQFAMAHSFEFFALALVFWSAVKMWEVGRRAPMIPPSFSLEIGIALICVIGISLTLLTRPSNLNVIFLPNLVLFILHAILNEKEKPPTRQHIRLTKTLGIASLLSLIPVALVFIQLYGKIYPNTYDMYGLILPEEPFLSQTLTMITLIPRIFYIFFSAEFGLIFSNPLLLFGTGMLLAQLVLQLRRHGESVISQVGLISATLLYIIFPLSIVLWWRDPGMDYGYRYLYSLFPLAFLGFIITAPEGSAAESSFSWQVKRLVDAIFLVLCVFSLAGQLFFGTTAQLSFKDQGLSLGFIVGPAAKNYEINLVRELFAPGAWQGLFISRLPGYAAIRILNLIPQDLPKLLATIGVDQEGFARWIDLLTRTIDLVPRVSVQLLLLSVFWALASWAWVFRLESAKSLARSEMEASVAISQGNESDA